MAEAWAAHDFLYLDHRVVFLPEPSTLEQAFRIAARGDQASPKLWADAYVAAFAQAVGAEVVTFDRALARRCKSSRLLLS